MNRSKKNDLRFWRKWRESGAVSECLPDANQVIQLKSEGGLNTNSFTWQLLTDGPKVIRTNGKIYPFGIIQVCNYGHDDGHEHGGIQLWSPELIKYGNGSFRASFGSPSSIEIINIGNNEIADVIQMKDMYYVEVWICKVSDYGFLTTIGSVGLRFGAKLQLPDYDEDKCEELRKAASGEKPSYNDNSLFTRVDEKLIGAELVEIRIRSETYESHQILVFTKNGRFVQSESDTWLSYNRWNVKMPDYVPYHSQDYEFEDEYEGVV